VAQVGAGIQRGVERSLPRGLCLGARQKRVGFLYRHHDKPVLVAADQFARPDHLATDGDGTSSQPGCALCAPRAAAARVEAAPQTVARPMPPAAITMTLPAGAVAATPGAARDSLSRQRTVKTGPNSRAGPIGHNEGQRSPGLPTASWRVAAAKRDHG
jgi:hypothetical protein